MSSSLVEKYKTDSNEVVYIKLVRNEEDCLSDEDSFHPEMSHQVFGESETIFGYKDLHIKLYYHAGSLLTYFNVEYAEVIPKTYGIKPDPIAPKITEIISEDYFENIEEYMKTLPNENKFKPMGVKIDSYITENKEEYEIYQADIFADKLIKYHKRLQTFLLWYVDASSFIDTSDEKWNFFLLFKKENKGSQYEYSIVGYLTVYHYFCYPDKYRPRISQVLVFPPYQRKGHGTKLLQSTFNYYISQAKASDITVEDPSEDLVRCRDYIDCKNCLKLDAFSKSNLLKGFSEDMVQSAFKMYKITKQQARRVYEILRFRVTDVSKPSQYRDYRLDVKNRLNAPNQKETLNLKKLEKFLSPEEFKAAMVGHSQEERVQRLDEAYKQLEEEYTAVLDRLDNR